VAIALAACSPVTLEPDPAPAEPTPRLAPVDERVGQIKAEPAALDMGWVASGDWATGKLVLQNTGDGVLRLATPRTTGDPGFEPRLVAMGASWADPDADGRPGIAPGGRALVEVRVRAAVVGALSAELSVPNSDPERADLRVPLRVRADRPCLEVSSDALTLRGALGERSLREIRLLRCGPAPVDIRAVELAPGTDPAFDIIRVPVEDDPVVVERVLVEYRPRAHGRHQGILRIRSNDLRRPGVDVRLAGDTARNACPEVTIEVVGQPRAVPGGEIVLDGSRSRDPIGRPVELTWVITGQPALSHPSLEAEGGEARLIPDLVGRYTVGLHVDIAGDPAGPGACRSSFDVVKLVVLPEAGLFVEVIGEGAGKGALGSAQVRPLLVHPKAEAWDELDAACDADGCPDWAPGGWEDGTGALTARVHVPEPVAPAHRAWRLGVEHLGASTAVVAIRVFFDGRLVHGDARALAPKQFWDALAIGAARGGGFVLPVDHVSRTISEADFHKGLEPGAECRGGLESPACASGACVEHRCDVE
jgi:hypothetical protein